MIWELFYAFCLFAGAFAACEIGYRLGRHTGPKDEAFTKQLDIIRGATFALVAFLIAFAFSGAGLALALAAFGNGQVGRRFPVLNFVYGFVLASALWMTIDLDHPRWGTIQASVRPLVDQLASMKPVN